MNKFGYYSILSQPLFIFMFERMILLKLLLLEDYAVQYATDIDIEEYLNNII
jgi:hypothetical protein